MARRYGQRSPFYSTARWKDLREHILRRDMWKCQMCGVMLRKGRSTKADDILRPAAIDHLIPHKGDAALFFDAANCWATCDWCHDGECQAIEARERTGRAMRAAKVAFRVVEWDGTYRTPRGRWVDQQAWV